MKKIYHFNYDYDVAEVTIAVDTNILTETFACAILDFYGRYYDEKTDCIGEVIKMCAMEVIMAGVQYGNDLSAIKEYVKESNGLDLLGAKSGIQVIDFKPFQFDEKCLELEEIQFDEMRLELKEIETMEN